MRASSDFVRACSDCSARHVRQTKFAHVDGGPSRGSSVRRPGSENPQRHEQNICFIIIILKFTLYVLNIYFPVILINQLISDEIEMSVGLFPFDV